MPTVDSVDADKNKSLFEILVLVKLILALIA